LRAEVQGVAVESTFNWYWLVDGLMEAGYSVDLVNTSAVHKYEGPQVRRRPARTLAGWRDCSIWASCRRDISIPSRCGPFGTSYAVELSWFATGLPTLLSVKNL